jgi:hypothetical protein
MITEPAALFVSVHISAVVLWSVICGPRAKKNPGRIVHDVGPRRGDVPRAFLCLRLYLGRLQDKPDPIPTLEMGTGPSVDLGGWKNVWATARA